MKKRTFRLADQIQFASLSGDFNPIHVDPIAARRLLFGGAVVHGVHIVLWCLEQLLQSTDNAEVELHQLKAIFGKSVRVDESVSLQEDLQFPAAGSVYSK